MKQTSFYCDQKPYFGGALLTGQRKSARPLTKKKPLHFVLKSKKKILFGHKAFILKILTTYAQKFGLKIYQISVQKDHVHFSARLHNREQYKKFIRTVTGLVARKLGPGLWKVRPFSRIVHWGRAYEILKDYISMNEREVLGLQPYTLRKHRYKVPEP